MSPAFHHTPRPAHVTGEQGSQCYFGATERHGILGVRTLEGGHALSVMRFRAAGREAMLIVNIDADGGNCRVHVELAPSELRELARNLIDAAADIDGQVDDKPEAA